ncbi:MULTISPECIES: DUF2278 family protein [unclassified Nitrosospira]|uniref:DUF2278 family protein n=1 Tax=unclassified Nitrosospira TaxID=2609267 RepID=UPI00210DDBB9|nr:MULTISPECIES: DUF2278 family protein [unclassified Nitrosospira]
MRRCDCRGSCARRFKGEDGVYQDGVLPFNFPQASQWVDVFLKFQSQTWQYR